MFFSRTAWYFLNKALSFFFLLCSFHLKSLFLVSTTINLTDIEVAYSSLQVRASVNLNRAYILYALLFTRYNLMFTYLI